MSLLHMCCDVCRSGDKASTPPEHDQLSTLDEAAVDPGDSSGVKPPLLPYTRTRRSKTSTVLATNSDGGTGSFIEGEMSRSSVKLLRSHSLFKSEGSGIVPRTTNRRDSQAYFAKQEQTVIVLDWDDTLFPTTYVNDDLGLKWQRPLHMQKNLRGERVHEVRQRLAKCEEGAREVMQTAMGLAHVVVVTLASTGWVDLACRHFYPVMGKLLKEAKVPIVYAQEKAGITETQYDKLEFQSGEEIEKFWGLVKGRAISEQVDKFYSQYAGQSWKNILSIGDSSFERYGLLVASSAYMQGRPLNGETGAPVWDPMEEACWSTVQDGHVKKLRAKCCKLVDQPDVIELTVELEMVSRWLQDMVQLDAGFDLDLENVEDEAQVAVIESVLRGELPVSELPRPPGAATAPGPLRQGAGAGAVH